MFECVITPWRVLLLYDLLPSSSPLYTLIIFQNSDIGTLGP